MIGSRSTAGFTFCNPEGRKTLSAALCILIALLLSAARTQAGDPSWRMLLEPKFMKPEVTFGVPESRQAVLTPALWKDGELVCMTMQQFKALGVDDKAFLEAARQNAADELKKLKPEYVRNRKKVIEYATLVSDSPLTASVVLAPDFLKMFADTLGPSVIFAVPNRYTVYVFPALATHYQDYAPMIYDAYHATAYPVSMEAYELSDQGLKTVGVYPSP